MLQSSGDYNAPVPTSVRQGRSVSEDTKVLVGLLDESQGARETGAEGWKFVEADSDDNRRKLVQRLRVLAQKREHGVNVVMDGLKIVFRWKALDPTDKRTKAVDKPEAVTTSPTDDLVKQLDANKPAPVRAQRRQGARKQGAKASA